MRTFLKSVEALFLATLLTTFAGCGGGGGGGGTPAPPAISVSLTPSAQTTIDQGQTVSFTATVAHDSNSKGVTWSVSGAACTGDTCGTFTNTTTTSATYNAPATVTSNLTVSVKATSVADTSKSASSTVVVTPAPSITTTTLHPGVINAFYTVTLEAAGGVGTLTWSIVSGTLPAGLTLNSSTGVISGTPTATGTSDFTVEVTDQAPTPATAQQQLSITINVPQLVITPATLANGVVSEPYSAMVGVQGGVPPYTWSIPSGLPAGLSLDDQTGQISGTPTATGTFTFTVTVTDSALPTPTTVSKPLSITITVAAAACTSTGNESVLTGQYTFTLFGFNGIGAVAVAGSFTADGTGAVTGGDADATGVLGPQSASIDSSSSYSVGPDNRGCATIVTSFGTFRTRLALGSLASGIATKGRIMEWESPAWNAYLASGQIQRQDPTAFSSGLSGSYAFGLVGRGSPPLWSVAGAMDASGGTFTNVEEDINQGGTPNHVSGLTGTYSSFDANGRATTTFASGELTVSKGAMYMISGSKLVYIQTQGPIMLGEVQKQTGTFSNSSFNSPGVLYATGLGADSGGEAVIGIVSGNGSGSLSGTIYEDNAGSPPDPDTVSCTYSVASNGRMTIGNCGDDAPVLYLYTPNTAFFVGMDSSIESGRVEAQAAGPFTNSSVSGDFFGGTDMVLNQSVSPAVVSLNFDGAGNVSRTADAVSKTDQGPDEPISDTYTVNSDGTLTLGDSGATIRGIIISGTKFVLIDSVDSTWPTIMVVEK